MITRKMVNMSFHSQPLSEVGQGVNSFDKGPIAKSFTKRPLIRNLWYVKETLENHLTQFVCVGDIVFFLHFLNANIVFWCRCPHKKSLVAQGVQAVSFLFVDSHHCTRISWTGFFEMTALYLNLTFCLSTFAGDRT